MTPISPLPPKPPTPQGISRLLKNAGYTRAVVKFRGGRSGFVVQAGRGPEVLVRHYWSLGGPARREQEQIAKYARTLTGAGWTVEAGEYELTVTAGPASSPLAAEEAGL